MKGSGVALLLGLSLIAGAVAINLGQRAVQRDDVRGIAGLRAELDSVRAALALAPPGPDSARLARSVADRTYWVERREFHVPSRQEVIDGWWRPTGLGTLLCLVGAIFAAAAIRRPGAHPKAGSAKVR